MAARNRFAHILHIRYCGDRKVCWSAVSEFNDSQTPTSSPFGIHWVEDTVSREDPAALESA